MVMDAIALGVHIIDSQVEDRHWQVWSRQQNLIESYFNVILER